MAAANPTNLLDEDLTKMCDPCSFRGVNTQAGTYCLVCTEYLCDSCELVHRRSKVLRDHELKPFEESQRFSIKQKALISSIMVCDIHRTETLTLFCVDHNIAVCDVCNTIKHRKCNTHTLKQISKYANKKRDVFQFTAKIKTLLTEIKELEQSRRKDKELIENCSRECILEVKKIKHQIIACAERLADDMEDNIANTQKQLLADMDIDIKAAVEMSKQMEQVVNSFETLGQDIEDVKFVFMMKEKRNIEDGIEMKDDILKQIKPVTLEFQQSEKLVILMSEITSMGRLEVKEKQISKPKIVERRTQKVSYQHISCTTYKESINAGTNYVTGCVFMPDGKLVICDEINKSIKVFTLDFKLKNELELGACVWDVAVVSKTEVVVTKPDSNSLQFLTVSNEIEKGKSISVGTKCWGIDCKNDKLYVGCHGDNLQVGVVKVLTMNGFTVNTFIISQGYPEYLAVNNSGDKILISTNINGVVCIDNAGNTLYTYDSNLNWSRGLLFDSYDNFMVCGRDTSNIHVVRSDGIQHRVILTADDGLYWPSCLAYRPSDNTLVVDKLGNHEFLAFTIR